MTYARLLKITVAAQEHAELAQRIRLRNEIDMGTEQSVAESRAQDTYNCIYNCEMKRYGL